MLIFTPLVQFRNNLSVTKLKLFSRAFFWAQSHICSFARLEVTFKWRCASQNFSLQLEEKKGCFWLKIISPCWTFNTLMSSQALYCPCRLLSWFAYESYQISVIKNEALVAIECDKTSKIIMDFSSKRLLLLHGYISVVNEFYWLKLLYLTNRSSKKPNLPSKCCSEG